MLKIWRFLYSIYNKPKNRVGYYFMQFVYFIYPNRKNLIRQRIFYRQLPYFNQHTVCAGDGVVEIGDNCSFGYKRKL